MRTPEYKSGESVVDEIKAEVKQTYLDLDKKTSNLGDAVAELKKRIDSKEDLEAITNNVKELEAGVKSAAERADKVDELLKKFNRPSGEGEVKSVEELVTKHARFEELKSRGFGKLHFEGAEAKAVTSAANSAGVTVARERQAGIIEREYRPLSIRDICLARLSLQTLLSLSRNCCSPTTRLRLLKAHKSQKAT
jgi:type I site-specific restriction-modification system R (restriction) subunit